MNYIQDIAGMIDAELPGLDSELVYLYALLALTTGTATTLENVHDAWAIWWNRSNPAHRSLVYFRRLAPEVQDLDREYRDGIRRVASAIGRDHPADLPDRIRAAGGL